MFFLSMHLKNLQASAFVFTSLLALAMGVCNSSQILSAPSFPFPHLHNGEETFAPMLIYNKHLNGTPGMRA